MIKKFNKQVTVEDRCMCCDVCEKPIESGSDIISINPAVIDGEHKRIVNFPDGPLQVCSIECLQHPATGLILNTKMIPKARENYKTYRDNITKQKAEDCPKASMEFIGNAGGYF